MNLTTAALANAPTRRDKNDAQKSRGSPSRWRMAALRPLGLGYAAQGQAVDQAGSGRYRVARRGDERPVLAVPGHALS